MSISSAFFVLYLKAKTEEITVPSFLEDINKFYGTGEKNSKGQSLEEFLEEYDPYKYKNPCCTTDAVVFSYKDELKKDLSGLKVLMVKRSNHPSIGHWALPGGFIELKENLEDTARRELEEETGVKDIAVEQFAVYGDVTRDPRARIITTAYMSLVKEDDVKVQAGDDAADAVWCDISLLKASMENDGEYVCDTYKLSVKNESRGLDTCATVVHKMRKGIIREEKYIVDDKDVIACDHAALMVQAYLLLKSRI